ncbi:MAG: hypothetical protein OEX00_10550 [Gammaproteobacteria bacterium]|nr:hypothetical protein [Gammaproteobacteria bacterium]MDH5692082.1 hypothetical protein [Gammaproteobacteria bacterium]
MIIATVTFESELTEQEAFQIAEERLPMFKKIPGLLQKYYVKTAQPNFYSGVYIWDSMESLKTFRESELAKTIPAAYRVKGAPNVVVGEIFTVLRD